MTVKPEKKSRRSLSPNEKITFKKMAEAGRLEKDIANTFGMTVLAVQKRIARQGIKKKEVKKDVEIEVGKLKAARAFNDADKIIRDNYNLIDGLFNNLGTLHGMLELNKNRIILAEKERGDKKDDRKHQELLLKTIAEINRTAETLVDLRQQLLSEEEIRIFKEAITLWVESKSPEFKKELIDVINRVRLSRQLNGINSSDVAERPTNRLTGNSIPDPAKQDIRNLEDERVLEGREPGGRYRIL